MREAGAEPWTRERPAQRRHGVRGESRGQIGGPSALGGERERQRRQRRQKTFARIGGGTTKQAARITEAGVRDLVVGSRCDM